MYVALFAMPVFGLTISIAPPFLIVHSAQLLLLPLLICLQHHRLAGNRIRAPAAEQANTNVLLPTIIHVWPQMSLSTLKRLPQGAMTQEASHREP